MPTLRNEQYEVPSVGDDYTEQDPETDGFTGHNPDQDDNESYTVSGVLAAAEKREKEAAKAEKHSEKDKPKES
jgi:hypothetical protein